MSDSVHRPLLNYSGFSDQWTTVKIADQFAERWQWGQGPYYDWCDNNCTDMYHVVKHSRYTIHGRFRNPADATAFALRWA